MKSTNLCTMPLGIRPMLYMMTLMIFLVLIIRWSNLFAKNIYYIKLLLYEQLISHGCRIRYVTSFADEKGFFKKFKRTQSIADKLNLNIARREANIAKRNAIKRYEQKMISNLSKDNLDVKTFWKLSKNILGCNSDRSIPPLIENDQVIPDDLSKATVFNNYFASISSFPENIQIPDLPNFNYLTETRLDSVTTNETEVESLLRRVNTHKSSGPDGVGNWVLKHCAKPLSVPYSKLFNKSL